MSRLNKKLMKPSENEFVDRKINETVEFPPLNIRLECIGSVLLLLNSEEEMVLVNVLKHLTEYVRRNDDNVQLLKDQNVLDLLRRNGFYRHSNNTLIRRFGLYLTNHILENMNRLVDLDLERTRAIFKHCLEYFCTEEDDVDREYLIAIICNLVDDPQITKELWDTQFLDNFLTQFSISNNPDLILNSLRLLEKILRVLNSADIPKLIALNKFPAERIVCNLNSEFLDLRRAALNLLAILMAYLNFENSPFSHDAIKVTILKELTQMFATNRMLSETPLVMDVLSLAMRDKVMVRLFFQHNLFDEFMTTLNSGNLGYEDMCQALKVISEIAMFSEYSKRLAEAGLVKNLLICLDADDCKVPSVHILKGLCHLVNHMSTAHEILAYNAQSISVIKKLLDFLVSANINIQLREEATNLILKLLKFAFRETSQQLIALNMSESLAIVFGQHIMHISTDLVLGLLQIVEALSEYSAYKGYLCKNDTMVKNLGTLLMNSFSSAILVSSIYRCLGTLIDVDSVRQTLLSYCNIGSSTKRGLHSLSNAVKTSACNFIIQTSHFQEFLCEYLDNGILETLIMQQKHAYCVPNWTTAAESILSKNPTLKFCIRNHLGFTDITKGHDFYISKKRFDDFRIFQSMLKMDASPLQPILVVNFDRTIAPQESIVRIPVDCHAGIDNEEWIYCRSPGDSGLPKLLNKLLQKLEEYHLQPLRQCPHIVDFDDIAMKVKIISDIVYQALSNDLPPLDLNDSEDCSQHLVKCHLKDLAKELHCNFIPLGHVMAGCHFERSVLFKALADQIGFPCTLTRSVDGRILYNEIPMPVEIEQDVHCESSAMNFVPFRMLRPTHIVDLMYNIGETYPLQSTLALKYLRLYSE
ncbi:uncharacterized protein LOC133333098 [Musca vetustissima]|uniref:uncharacterized protein LOC133333098 n=1 Tax=Musca vetustissima TaxID=27455 RepID=UPI002AB5FBA3|nr:uncharacterized protein LOC133333098 [Musca vetustissima]